MRSGFSSESQRETPPFAFPNPLGPEPLAIRAGLKAPINRTHCSKRFARGPSQRTTRQRLECVRLQRRFPKANPGFDGPGRFMESPLLLFRMLWAMNYSKSLQTVLRAPSPPLGEKDGMRGRFMERSTQCDRSDENFRRKCCPLSLRWVPQRGRFAEGCSRLSRRPSP